MPKRRGARAADSEPSPKARRSEGTSAMRLETALSKADDASEAFFELANAASIAVTVPGESDVDVTILQDPANTTTGGCVWETAYVLAEWAYWRLPVFTAVDLRGRLRRPRCLELGAGCGLIGMLAANWAKRVDITDGDEEEVALIGTNVAQHAPAAPAGAKRGQSDAVATCAKIKISRRPLLKHRVDLRAIDAFTHRSPRRGRATPQLYRSSRRAGGPPTAAASRPSSLRRARNEPTRPP